jgi:glycosyltransferase involved in cell wall biosynthesis
VYDGVRLTELQDDATRQSIRRELGLPLVGTVVAMTGQVAEVKGIWDFIDAAGMLVTRGVPVSFAVLGDDLKGRGALREHAEKVVAERGLSAHVRFLGFRPNAPRLIPAFDIIAVPSHIEPLGNATLEAMAAGLPVIGSRVGGIPEMIVDGETGLLVESRNAAALAAAIESLVRDPGRARAFGRAGRARAEQVFSVAAHVSHVQAVYDRLLATRGAR